VTAVVLVALAVVPAVVLVVPAVALVVPAVALVVPAVVLVALLILVVALQAHPVMEGEVLAVTLVDTPVIEGVNEQGEE